MNTFDTLAAGKRPYQVLTPPSVAYWFALALIAEHNGRPDLRDRCLERTAAVAAAAAAFAPPSALRKSC